FYIYFFFSSRRRHTRFSRDWSSDVCSSDLGFAVVEGHVLRQQAEMVAAGQQAFELLPGLVDAADGGQCVDVPEAADGEAGLRLAEVVGGDVAEQRGAAAQVGADRLDGGDEARVVGVDEAELGEQ